jgi:hypothetical protein
MRDRGRSELKLGGDEEPCNFLTMEMVPAGLLDRSFDLTNKLELKSIYKVTLDKPDLDVFQQSRQRKPYQYDKS